MKVAGSGVTGDLLAHCIDTAMWLNGPIDTVTAMTETFIKERKHTLTGKVQKVGDRRRVRVPCRSERFARDIRIDPLRARPQSALHVRNQRRERFALLGSARPASAAVFDHRDEGKVRGWRTVHITDGDHPYMKNWWVPGLQIGYEHTFIHQVADFIQAA